MNIVMNIIEWNMPFGEVLSDLWPAHFKRSAR